MGDARKTFRTLTLAAAAALAGLVDVTARAAGGEAFGAPGAAPHWGPSTKSFVGTAVDSASRVYFTGYRGIVSEVFYPVLDTVEAVDLQFLVGDEAGTFVDEEKLQEYTVSRPEPRALLWRVDTCNQAHGWCLHKNVFTDPGRDALVLRVTFEPLGGRTANDFRLYLLHNPAMDLSGGGDAARSVQASGRTMLVAADGRRASALAVSLPWRQVSSGYEGQSDGWTDLLGGSVDRRMDWSWDRAPLGNVAQMGWIDTRGASSTRPSFDVVLAFGASEAEATSTAGAVLSGRRSLLEKAYVDGWRRYAAGLDDQGGTADAQYYLAAMALKAIQDKSNGAMIAGMGTPWGESAGDSNRIGYHVVWPRDLFKFANALLTAGDRETAARAVEYLFTVLQQRSDCGNAEFDASGCPQGYSRRGRFPQNAWVSGWQHWTGTQLDQQAMPILLAWRVWERGDAGVKARVLSLWPQLRATADYILEVGPWTHQERWEESSGYSPSTIAAEIAGLVAAAAFARRSGDDAAAGRYLAAADDWQLNVDAWTFTTTGPHGDGRYYLRLNPSARSNAGAGLQRYHPASGPDAAVTYVIGNGGGTHDQRQVCDLGFLELVRMGVRAPDDPAIVRSLASCDPVLKQSLPGKGDAWFRYGFDGYGEANDGASYTGPGSNGRGRLWPIFTAERGIYEIGRTGSGASGVPYLQAVRSFSTREGMIPEQVWNVTSTVLGWQTTTPPPYEPGTATRSMAPLNWAMGEYISLVASIHAGRIVDVPEIVCGRYSTCRVAPAAGQVALEVKATAQTAPGERLYVTGDAAELGAWNTDLGVPCGGAGYPAWSARVAVGAGAALEYKYYRKRPDGAVQWESLPGGGNRRATTPASGTASVEDVVVWP